MKSLKTSVKESFFDDVEDITSSDFEEVSILNFLKENYNVDPNKISIRSGDSKLIVDINGNIGVKNKNLEYLTTDLFEFGIINGDFRCNKCNNLKSLKGAPNEVDGDFECGWCIDLISLEGAPIKVGEDFYCTRCPYLKSLKGAPKEVGGDFFCRFCNSLKSLEGAPKKIKGDLYCSGCHNLKSLKGVPNIINGIIDCRDCSNLTIAHTDRKKYKIVDK